MSVYESTKTQQRDIQAGGDVAGRDIINKNTTIYSAPIIHREDKRLKALLAEHELEMSRNPDYKHFSQKLNDYLFRKVEKKGKLRNLEEKLTDGGREFLVEYALELKESVTMKITKNSHFESAQKIYTYLLAEIRTIFIHEVAPRIKSEKFETYQIDDTVVDRVIDPLLMSVDGCSLLIDREELYGLLYILTGNCYIDWDLE